MKQTGNLPNLNTGLCAMKISKTEKMRRFILRAISCLIPCRRARRAFRFRHGLTKYGLDHIQYNIGDCSYLGSGTVISNPEKTVIGSYCSISHEVYIDPTAHSLHFLTTHSFIHNRENGTIDNSIAVPEHNLVKPEFETSMPVIIDNDVWIGYRAIIMPGVHIHDGAVIAAGAIVTKDIPPYAIAAGVPAKVIKYRFSQPVIDDLLRLKWWEYPKSFIAELPFSDIPACIKKLESAKHLKEKKNVQPNIR